MQKFKPLFFLIVILSSLSLHSYSQKVLIFGHGIYSSPSGSAFNDAYRYGLGVEAGAGLGLGRTYLTATLGYSWFDASSGENGNMSYSPVKFGLRQYIFRKLLYLKADAGTGFINKRDVSTTKFVYDVGVGAKLSHIDLGIDFNSINLSLAGYDNRWSNWIEFKAGFAFGL